MIFYRKIPQVQALSFDLDDTLYDNHPLMLKAEKKLLDFIQNTYSSCVGKEIYFWRSHKTKLLKDTPQLKNDMGELRLRTLNSGFAECGYSGKELQQAVQKSFDYFYFERSNFSVNKTVCSLLSELSNKVPLIAITNGNVNLEQIGIKPYFLHCLKASVQQPMKPHRHMFDQAQSLLSIAPEHILHVGDNMEKDVFGARAAGFSTAWFACNRGMELLNEKPLTLPDIELQSLQELLLLI